MEEQIFNNRVEQEVQRRLNLEHQAAAQTAAVQAQQAANTYGGYGYNRWASQPIYHMPQDGAVAIGERVSLPNDILETGVSCVERLAEKLGKDVQKFCKEITKEALEESGNISRSARKAVRSPLVLIPRYGW